MTDKIDPLFTEAGSEVALRLAPEIYTGTLIGHAPPRTKDMFDRMSHPVIGDAVVVMDAQLYRDPITRHQGVGYLREIVAGETVSHDRHHVQYGPESVDICKWSNCRVIAIPPFATPEET